MGSEPLQRPTTDVAEVVLRLAVALADPAHDDVDAIAATAATLGELLHIDRVYLFEHAADGTTSNTVEWCATDVTPQREHLQALPIDTLAAWDERFERGEAVAITDVAALPHGAAERELLEPQGIRSLLVVPLRSGGRTIGFIGLDDVRGPRSWPSEVVTPLQVAAGLVAGTLARRTAERAADALRHRLQTVNEQIPGALFRLEREPDGRRRFTYVGPHFRTLLGIDPAPLEHDAEPALERILDEDRAAFAASLTRSGTTLARWEHDFRAVDADGRVRHLLGRAAPQPRGDGGMAWNGLVLDISDVHAANAALRRTEANLRAILEVDTQALLLIDAQHRILDMNDAARRRLERIAGTVPHVGDRIDEVVPAHTVADDLARSLGGETVAEVRQIQPPDGGTPYWVDVRWAPILDEHGAAHAVVVRSDDITERIEAEREREHEDRFRRELLTLITELLSNEFSAAAYQRILDHAVRTIPGAEAGSVVVATDDGTYRYVAATGYDLEALRTIVYDADSVARVEPADATVIVGGFDNHEHDGGVQATLATAGRGGEIRATLVAPVDVAGRRLGFVHLDAFRGADAFDARSVDLAKLLASTVAVAMQRLELEHRLIEERSRLAHAASHDALTGLPNRIVLADRLGHALARDRRRGRATALLMIDLDGFKAVNDRYGHGVGDDLLRRVAERLRSGIRTEDTLARLGGDEFALVAGDVERAEDALAIAHKCLDALREPLQTSASSVLIGASIGIAMAPTDGTTAASLLQLADLALYRVKREGRGSIAFYTAALDSRMRERAALADDLRAALRDDVGLEVHYQPIVRLADGAVAEVEALARWTHAHRGTVPPSTFVDVAEEAGLIPALGRRVVEHVVADVRRWRARGVGERWRCAVNVSAVELRSQRYVDELLERLAAGGLGPHDLVVEVTESTVMDHTGTATTHLRRLRALGARVAIDDFGTGYSSLSRLTELPVDVVKIDRSFVAALTDDGAAARPRGAVVDAIIALAGGLGLQVVAEGVETEAQRRALVARGCTLGQGYLFGRPMGAHAIGRGAAADGDGTPPG